MSASIDTSEFTILIVDDEASVRQSLDAWFRDDGYTVLTADNAAAALSVMQERQVDIILLDIKMPAWTASPCRIAFANSIRMW